MHRMHTGLETEGDTERIWHIAAVDSRVALCGRELDLSDRVSDPLLTGAMPHCDCCMQKYRQLIDGG